MKNIFLSLALLCLSVSVTRAQDYPVEVTPATEKKIKQEIEASIPKFRERLKTAKGSELYIEFVIDTFRIEQYMAKYISYDYSTAGMSSSGYEAAHKYDSLLNKYYKKLLNVLSPEDKKILVAAQKTWINYRDSETELVNTIGKDQYSGGGTIQQLIESSSYMDLVKNRAIEIFEHLRRATQDF